MKNLIIFIGIFFFITTYGQQGCYFTNATPINNPTKFSNNQLFDLQVNNEYEFLKSKFTVSPDLFYFTDGISPNAYASSLITNPYLTDGSVYIGFNLINTECGQSWTGSCSSVAIIMAHEFAHIVDYKYKLNLYGKNKELFADYLAGCYMHLRSFQFAYTNVSEVAWSFYSKGDQGFFNPFPHGTPIERYNALLAGYNYSIQTLNSGVNYNLNDAVLSAFNYLKL